MCEFFLCVFDAMCMGSLVVLAGTPPLVAICVVCLVIVFLMLCAWVFDRFYMCGFSLTRFTLEGSCLMSKELLLPAAQLGSPG